MTNHIKHGNFRINRTNKGLDRPRTEGHRVKVSCISVGVPAEKGTMANGMNFDLKRHHDERFPVSRIDRGAKKSI